MCEYDLYSHTIARDEASEKDYDHARSLGHPNNDQFALRDVRLGHCWGGGLAVRSTY